MSQGGLRLHTDESDNNENEARCGESHDLETRSVLVDVGYRWNR